MLARIRRIQHAQALQVLIVAQATQWCAGLEFFLAQGLERAHRHLAGEEAGADGVHSDVVLAPFGRQRAGEVDHRALGGVVGNGVHAAGVATQTGDGRHVDDAALLAGNHAVLGDVLAQDEIAAHVQVHHLVPGVHRVVFGRRAPGGACVVHEDVHMATQAANGFVGQAADVGLVGAVSGNPLRINASGFQLGNGLFQVRRLARAEQYLGTGFAQRVGQLQAQAARAAGDQGGLALEVEELLDGAMGHVVSPCVCNRGWAPLTVHGLAPHRCGSGLCGVCRTLW